MTKRKEGFTLIELLVVIALIAILASMLLPALARAKEKAHHAVCLSNLRQWGLAQNMYVDDNGQKLPDTKIANGTPPNPINYSEDMPKWTDLVDFNHFGYGNSAWFNALPSYVHTPPLWTFAAGSTAQVSKNSYNSGRNIFHCPTAVTQPLDPFYRQNSDTICFPYGMNSKGMWSQVYTPNGGVTNHPVKTSMIKQPSAYVMFSDNRVLTSEAPPWDTSSASTIGSPQNYTSRFSSRHDQGGDITFSDGHAAFFKYRYVVVNHGGKPSDPARPDINWTLDGTSADGLSP